MIAVSYLGGDRLHIDVRGHELSADQPVEDGGGDTAPTPTELFVAGLSACVGFYPCREGPAVVVSFGPSDHLHRSVGWA